MLRFADSFEHYNSSTANMLLGLWSGFTIGGGGSISISASQARTGTKSLKLVSANGGGGGNAVEARFAIGAQSITFGLGGGAYLVGLPSGAQKTGFQFRDAGNNPLLTICIQSDGSLCARKGSETGAIIEISDSVLSAGTFNHIECKATIDTVAGYVEIRVNGVPKLQIGSLNLGAVAAATCVLAHFGISTPDIYWDDVITWDDTGTRNNDFMGAQRVLTVFPAADTAQADFTVVGAASGYLAINSPDGDTSYIGADTINEKSDFTLPALPTELVTIAGVFIPAMARIDAAGIGNLKISMKSGASLLAGPDTTLTTGYTYYRSAFEYDPVTNVAWTKSGFEAALVRVEKSL